MDLNTSHCRHRIIFLCQFCCTSPWQMVPFINQHIPPSLNSHAGQLRLVSTGHFRITQQALLLPPMDFFWNKRKSKCRSVCTGISLHPCSKLCMALGDTLNNRANWTWVLPRKCRARINPLLSTEKLPQSFSIKYYTTTWSTSYHLIQP